MTALRKTNKGYACTVARYTRKLFWCARRRYVQARHASPFLKGCRRSVLVKFNDAVLTSIQLLHTTHSNMSKDATGRVSHDIVDQSSFRPDPVRPEPTSSSSPRFVAYHARPSPDMRSHHSPNRDSPRVGDKPNGKMSLSVDLTGFSLLNITSIVVFGIWKLILTEHKGLVAVTKAEFTLLLFSALTYAFHSRE